MVLVIVGNRILGEREPQVVVSDSWLDDAYVIGSVLATSPATRDASVQLFDLEEIERMTLPRAEKILLDVPTRWFGTEGVLAQRYLDYAKTSGWPIVSAGNPDDDVVAKLLGIVRRMVET